MRGCCARIVSSVFRAGRKMISSRVETWVSRKTATIAGSPGKPYGLRPGHTLAGADAATDLFQTVPQVTAQARTDRLVMFSALRTGTATIAKPDHAGRTVMIAGMNKSLEIQTTE